ncbi:MAG: hypothetical protein AAFR63_07120 [Cyanobacteria bacterium J06631_6]
MIPFESSADNLLTDDLNSVADIFIYDRSSETIELVSITNDSSPANGSSSSATISGNGQYVVFSSFASNLVADDTNNLQDIFLRDRLNQTT